MARITGPLHSDDASGRFAGSTVFAKWKGRKYARALVTPANPKSPAQTGVRAMMRYLSQLWATIAASAKASWNDLAAAANISPFNSFVGHNLQRWQQNRGSTDAYPAAEVKSALLAEQATAAGHEGYATLSATPHATDSINASAVVIFRGKTAPEKSWAQAIAILPVTPGTLWNYTDSPLPAGTYHYNIAYMSDDGVIGTISLYDKTVTVT